MSEGFLSNRDLQQLVEAIRVAEHASTGEIRVHIDRHSTANFAQEALAIFSKLEMHHTKERNGVLFYVNFEQRYLTIIGDEGIHAKVKQAFWDVLHDEITNGFAQGNYFIALKEAILKTGNELKKYFPVEGINKNELTDEISIS